MKPISTCAKELSARAADDGRWTIRIDELSDLTGVPQTELFSAAYRLGDKVTFSDAVDGFTDETAGELLTLLEEFYNADVEAALTDYGVFIPHDRRLDLMANFLALIQHQASNHTIDQDTFLAMLLHFKSFEESFRTYVEEFFEIETAMGQAAEYYRSSYELPVAAMHAALNYLRLLFVRKVLQIRGLFVSLRNQLAELARAHGFMGRRRERYYTYEEPGPDEPAVTGGRAVQEALATMQLRKDELSRERLKQQYKHLMKRYHPDINPRGLEMSKRITSSYSLLLQAV